MIIARPSRMASQFVVPKDFKGFRNSSISDRRDIPEGAIGLPEVIFEDMIEEEEIRAAVERWYGDGEQAVP